MPKGFSDPGMGLHLINRSGNWLRGAGSLAIGVLLMLPIFVSNLHPSIQVYAQVEDMEPPHVIGTSPSPDSTDVPLGTPIAISFDEPIDITTLTSETFLVNDGSNKLEGVISTDDLSLEFVCYFTPVSSLEFSTNYEVTVTNGVTDLAGNNLEEDYSFSFKTDEEDLAPPEIVTAFPEDGAVGISIYRELSVTFSEPIDTSTITPSSLTVSDDDGNLVDGFVFSPDDLTITFSTSLAFSTTYTATVHAGSLTDTHGNPLQSDFTWSFTTRSEKEAKQKVTSDNIVTMASAQWNDTNSDGLTTFVRLEVTSGDLYSVSPCCGTTIGFPPFGPDSSLSGTTIAIYRYVLDAEGNFIPDSLLTGITLTSEDVFEIDQNLNTAILAPIEIEVCFPSGLDENGNCIDVIKVDTIEAQWSGIGDVAVTDAEFGTTIADSKVIFDATAKYKDAVAFTELNGITFGPSDENDQAYTSLRTLESSKVKYGDVQVTGISLTDFEAPVNVIGSKTIRGGELVGISAVWSNDNQDGTVTDSFLLIEKGGGTAGRINFFSEGTFVGLDRITHDLEGNIISSRFSEKFFEQDEDIFTVQENLNFAILKPVDLDVCAALSYFDCFVDDEFKGTETWQVQGKISATEKAAVTQEFKYSESTTCVEFDFFGNCIDASSPQPLTILFERSARQADATATISVGNENLGQGEAGIGNFRIFVTESHGEYPHDIFPIQPED